MNPVTLYEPGGVCFGSFLIMNSIFSFQSAIQIIYFTLVEFW